jgi:hypothetical protein
MRLRMLTLVRALWMASACLAILPHAATAGGSSLAADFDGDGQRDHVTLNRREPSTVRIWLSATGTTQVIHTRAPVQQLIAADLDGDHNPEIVARDSKLRILVWTRKKAAFTAYARHKHRGTPGKLTPMSHRGFDDANSSDSSDTDASLAPAPLALALCPFARAPNLVLSNSAFPSRAAVVRLLAAIDPFRPRPPPPPSTL